MNISRYTSSLLCCAFSSALSATLLPACTLTSQNSSSSSASGATKVAALTTEKFSANNKADVLLVVNGSPLSTDQQQSVQNSLQNLVEGLTQAEINYQIGVVNTATSGVLAPINGQNFLTPGMSPQTLISSLVQQLSTSSTASSTMPSSQSGQVMIDLIPIVMTIANDASQGKNQNQILQDVAPLVLVASGHSKTASSTAMTNLVNSMIAKAVADKGQSNTDQEIVSALLPLAIMAASDYYGGGTDGEVASFALPIVLQLATNASQGQNFFQLLAEVTPLAINELETDPQFSDEATIIAIVTPLVTDIAVNQGAPVKQIVDSIMPTLLNVLATTSSNSTYGQLLTAIAPSFVDMILENGTHQNPSTYAAAVADLGLSTALQALSPSLLGSGGANAGFLRPDSILSVILVNDLPGQVSFQNPATVAQSFLSSLASSSGIANQNDVQIAALLASNPTQCGAENALLTAVAQLTAGQVADTCSNPSALVSTLTDDVVGKIFGVNLSQLAQLPSIQVTVNGVLVPMNSTNGWTLAPNGVSIVFHGSAIPANGAAVDVAYAPQS